MISFDCCCANKSLCSDPLFVLPFGLPGPRFSIKSAFFVPVEFSSKMLLGVFARVEDCCIFFKLSEVVRGKLPGSWDDG